MRRRNEEIRRLNEVYRDILPVKETLQRCLKYLCQSEPYRMLKNWSYEEHADPIESEDDQSGTPEFNDVGFSLLFFFFFFKFLLVFFIGRS